MLIVLACIPWDALGDAMEYLDSQSLGAVSSVSQEMREKVERIASERPVIEVQIPETKNMIDGMDLIIIGSILDTKSGSVYISSLKGIDWIHIEKSAQCLSWSPECIVSM